jgi:plasmid stabilization system protein ParE
VSAPAWTLEAVESLREIYGHIALDRPRTAERTLESILNKVASLSAAPRSGQRYPYAGDRQVFVLTYGHFRIAYSIDSDQPGITVLGVFHGLIFLPKR